MAFERPSLDRKAELAKFEEFLFEMDEVLEEFIDQSEKSGYPLNYSLDSLGELEGFLLTLVETSKANESEIQRSARYFGETVRRVYGGQWMLEIDNPRHLYYGLPILTGHARSSVELCPIQTVRMFLKGKPKGFFKQVVASQIDPPELDLRPEK